MIVRVSAVVTVCKNLFRTLVSSTLHGVRTVTYKGRNNNTVGKIPVEAILRARSRIKSNGGDSIGDDERQDDDDLVRKA
jgi:hypothetical protein